MAKEQRDAGAVPRLSPSLRDRAFLILQLLATLAALGWVAGNYAKLAVLLIVWVLGFRRLSRAELVFMAAVNAIFIMSDSGALHQGIFRFCHPDVIGMPIYEFFMWGFYALHTIRMVGRGSPRLRLFPTVPLAAAFAVSFVTPQWLLLAPALVLALALFFHHERDDLLYASYMIVVGTLIEYVGTGTGQWTYPASPPGGVPAWFVTMWGGIGLFICRLAAPLLIDFRSPRAGFL